MISHQALAGYLLEELLASLMQSAGYRLLAHESQDSVELTTSRSGDLQVRGRGAVHQVDVLGEFTVVPAFSQPVRLFVEAKAVGTPVGLDVIRNAVGTINDVNEAWMLDYSTNHTRRHYRYALFSTSGFSANAQQYAIAHQIGLVDLSGPEWGGMRRAINHGADDLLTSAPPSTAFPVRILRQLLRRELGTTPDSFSLMQDARDQASADALLPAVRRLRQDLTHAVDGALLAFPAGQQVLLARPDDLDAFLHRVERQPQHRVSLAVEQERSDRTARTWVVQPTSLVGGGYSLRLTLPAAVEDRALAESDRLMQSLAAKGELGGRLDIFWDPRRAQADRLSGPRLFRLVFAGAELRERKSRGGTERPTELG